MAFHSGPGPRARQYQAGDLRACISMHDDRARRVQRSSTSRAVAPQPRRLERARMMYSRPPRCTASRFDRSHPIVPRRGCVVADSCCREWRQVRAAAHQRHPARRRHHGRRDRPHMHTETRFTAAVTPPRRPMASSSFGGREVLRESLGVRKSFLYIVKCDVASKATAWVRQPGNARRWSLCPCESCYASSRHA